MAEETSETVDFNETLTEAIKRRSVLRERKAKIDAELDGINESVMSTMKEQAIETFKCPKGAIKIVRRATFKPFDRIKVQIDQLRNKAEALGHGESTISEYPHFTTV